MATKEQEELAAWMLAAGITAHAVSDIISRGRLTRAETGLLLKVLKKAVPIAGRVVAGEIVGAATTVGLAGRAALTSPRTLIAGAARNPYTLAAALLYLGYIKREEIAEVGAAIAEDPRTEAAYEQLIASGRGVQQALAPISAPLGLPGIRPLAKGRERFVKRKVSKANRAVKQAMTWLKAGGKALTGTKAGKLPKGAFKTAVRAAGAANPNTKSRIGKGKTTMNKLARRLKKWW